MRFQAHYGLHGPEPYFYEGEFANAANGSLQVGNVKLTRRHIGVTHGGNHLKAELRTGADQLLPLPFYFATCG
jgi:hypothetical protein